MGVKSGLSSKVHKLRVFENRALRGIFRRKRRENAEKSCIIRNFIICTLHKILLN
jgi:hypothetical protein